MSVLGDRPAWPAAAPWRPASPAPARALDGIITADEELLRRLADLPRIAEAEAPVLVLGETGTGKELVARALHARSPRRQRPFVTVHCAALSTSLLESELFGHVTGAFTGAQTGRRGRLAAATGGTLFLDELGEIPLATQTALLRFVQCGEIQRVGADVVERLDVRLIGATHRDLAQLVRAGHFREDLYYRLKVLDFHLPPLRERRADVLLLAEHFLAALWRRPGPPPRLDAAAAARLLAYDFPGNVRELAHAIERACILSTGPEIGPDLLPAEIAAGGGRRGEMGREDLTLAGLRAARRTALAEAERAFIAVLMTRHGGNVSRAARESGIHRSQLQRLLARLRSPGSAG